MKSTGKKIIILLIFLLVIILTLIFLWYGHQKKNALKHYRNQDVPTLYIHGYSGTANSTNQLIQAATKKGVAEKVLTATIASNGKVTLRGKWPQRSRNPLIQVIFKNNRATPEKDALWLQNLLKVLQRKYQIKDYYTVAHSMGATAVMALLLNGQQGQLPQLKKFVAIAGPFNGIIGYSAAPNQPNQNKLQKNNEPLIQTPSYQEWLTQRNRLNPKLKILNIFGNLDDGSHSDGRVTVVSARSLHYLVQGKIASYQEDELFGEQAQHSRLHNNATVNFDYLAFLWGK